MKNSKSSSTGTGSRNAKSSGGSDKPTPSRPVSVGAPHTKQSSQRAASSSNVPQSKVQSKPDKVVFSGSAKRQLNALGLDPKHRQEVESWHKRTVRREMNHIGADHAKIRHLAHARGSNDGKPHITASLKKDGDTIKNAHGNLSHLYYDEKRVPPVYKVGAVQRNLKDGSS